jgi:L-glutamine-phosphate cytidylyltransferase
MKAIILAAGRGSRMKHATDNVPKCLLKVKGKTLLEIQIEALKKAGIKEIGIVTGYLSEQLRDYCENTFHNDKWDETNMVFSLMSAKNWLRQSDCVVSYSDIYYDDSIVKKLIKYNCQIGVAYDPNWQKLWQERFKNPLSDAETFQLSINNNIIEIGNKTSQIKEIQGQYMGLMKFTIKGWSDLEKIIATLKTDELKNIQLTQLLQKCISSGLTIKAISNNSEWGEVDSQKDLELYNLK